MRKRCIAALVLVAALASQPTWASAMGSTSSSGSGGGDSISSSSSSSNKGTTSSKSGTTVPVLPIGVKTTGTTASASPTGSTVGVAIDTVMTTGQQVTTNSKGEAVIGDTAIIFADSAVTIIGFPSGMVSTINDINAEKPLNEAIQGVGLTGCNALTGIHAIIMKDAATGAVKTGAIEISLYMPNLVSNVNNIQVLFYDNTTGQWQLIPAAKVDPVTRTITVNVPGSGTLSVVYKD